MTAPSAVSTLAPGGMLHDLMSMQMPPAEKVIRTIVVYLGILVIIRVAGKRLMAQMNSLDLVVVLLLSNVVQNAIIGDDNTLLGGLLGAVVLVAVNALLDRWAQASPRVGWLLNGSPTVVIHDGAVLDNALRRLGMSHEELHNALRQQGVDDPGELELATMEPGGTLTVRLKPGEKSANVDDLLRAVEQLTERIDALGRGVAR